jgi:N-acetylglutamate synthase-like GNAT family acetyltransferase
VSAYSLVLREALAQNKKADEIAAFITAGGGVEEIRRSKSGNAKTPAQKAELGKAAVAEQQLATFNSDTLAVLAQNAGKSVGDELVAVIAQQADGSFVVRALVSSNTALNAALCGAYSANRSVVKNDKAANDEKTLDELINKAA